MRVELPIVVLNPVSPYNPVSGAQVVVINQETGFATTVYTTSSSSAEVAQPILTDVSGRIDGWVERGAYAIEVTIPGRPTYTEYFEASPAKDGSVDTDWLENSSVTTSKLDNAAVTAAKLASSAVTSSAIASGAVTESKLASSAVTTAKIAEAAITSAKVDATTVALVPLGTILDWFPPATASAPWTSALPPGYAVCDGTAWSSIPNDLGYTTGNIPNLTGRISYGANASLSAGTAATHDSATGAQTAPGVGGNVGSNTISQSHSHTVPAHSHGMAHQHTVPSHTHYMAHSHGVNPHSHSISSKALRRDGNEPLGTVSIASSTGSSGGSTDGGNRSYVDYSGNIGTTDGRNDTDNSSVLTTGSPTGFWDNRVSGIGILKIMKVRNL